MTGGGLAARGWYLRTLEPVEPNSTEAVLFRITPGMSSGDVAEQLKELDLIQSELAFRWYLLRHGLSLRLQAGLYQLHEGMDVPQIAARIARGDTAGVGVTITSGLRLGQIKQILIDAGYQKGAIDRAFNLDYDSQILRDKPPKASLEGYLFPDTYLVDVGLPPEEMIKLILTNTEQKLNSDIIDSWKKQGLNIHQGVTLTSIVQKEVAKVADQRQVAQVFLKRLKIGMRLEADPTFEYAAAVFGGRSTPALNHPYNTYKYGGLPPGPISNFELSTAQAVGNPADTNWLYFLSDGSGVTHFTASESEHKQNIERYLR